MISGITCPSSGKVTIDENTSIHEDLFYIGHKYGLKNELSVADNIKYTLGFHQRNLEEKNIIDELINNIISSLLISYHSLMESKYLEVNILLQNYKNNTSNKILDDKIDHIITNNFLLFERYFKNFFKEEDLRNIFSEFNKLIHFSNILNSLNSFVLMSSGNIIFVFSSKS